jgi:serine/threonine protein kinase
MVGTLNYLAPETIDGANQTEKVDHWALGGLIYEFVVRRASFEADDQHATMVQDLQS